MYIETSLTRNLDEQYEISKTNTSKLSHATLISNLPGFGTTSSIKGWLAHNNYKHLYISGWERNITMMEVECFKNVNMKPQVSIVDAKRLEDLFIPVIKEVPVMFTSDELDSIEDESIVVIDDYSRCDEEVRKELLNIITRQTFVDPRYPDNECRRFIKFRMLIVVLDESLEHKLTDYEKRVFGL